MSGITSDNLLCRLAAVGLLAGVSSAGEPRVDCHGDPLPAGAVARLGMARLRGTAPIVVLAFAPDGRTLASVSQGESRVQLWDVGTGREVRTFAGHDKPVRCVAFAPDGKLLAAGGEDETVRLWEPGTGKGCGTRPSEARVEALAFAPDGKTLAVGTSDGRIRLWERRDGRLGGRVRPLDKMSEGVAFLTFAGEGRYLVAGTRGKKVRVWDVGRGKMFRSYDEAGYGPQAWAVSADGRTLVLGGEAWLGKGKDDLRSEFGIRVHDVAGGRVRSRWTWRENPVHAFALTPDGRTLAVGCEGRLSLWDVATGRRRMRLAEETSSVRSLAFSPDGKLLASGDAGCLIRLWDVATGRERLPVGDRTAPILAARYSPDGRVVAAGGGMDGAVHLWDSRTGRRLRTLPSSGAPVTHLAWSPDGRTLASAGLFAPLRLWDPATCRARRTLSARRASALITSLAFAPGGKEVVAGLVNLRGGAGSLCVWGTATGGQRLSLSRGAGALAWAADGKSLVAVPFSSGDVYWLDSASGTVMPSGRQAANGLVGGAGGRVVVSWLLVRDERIDLTLWDPSTREARHRVSLDLALNQGWGGQRMCCSPDGRTLATGGSDHHIRLWDLASGKEILRVPTPCAVEAVDFAPDGRRIVSVQADGTGLVWDLRACALVQARLRSEDTDDVKKLWAALAGHDPGRAYRAMWQLVSTPGPAVALLKERVRVMAGPGGRRVRKLLADLDDDAFGVREAAQRELRRLGAGVEPDLRRLLAGKPPLEVRRRAKRLLGAMPRTFGPLTAEERGPVRAVRVLEQIGTPEARRLLEALAGGGAAARQTREAKEALARLAKRDKGG